MPISSGGDTGDLEESRLPTEQTVERLPTEQTVEADGRQELDLIRANTSRTCSRCASQAFFCSNSSDEDKTGAEQVAGDTQPGVLDRTLYRQTLASSQCPGPPPPDGGRLAWAQCAS